MITPIIPFGLVLFLFFFLIIFTPTTKVVGIFPTGPAPTILTQGTSALQIGYVQDINNDGLPDVILSYYNRNYQFASLVIFINDGCQFVRHFNPLQPIIYCAYYFENVRRNIWEQNPPLAKITLFNQTKTIPLPFQQQEVPFTISKYFNVPVTSVPRMTFRLRGTRVAYPAIYGQIDVESVLDDGGSAGRGAGTSGSAGRSRK
ncbi:hypothetical protein ABK040_014480 [Willaertia magna]